MSDVKRKQILRTFRMSEGEAFELSRLDEVNEEIRRTRHDIALLEKRLKYLIIERRAIGRLPKHREPAST